MTSYGAGLYIFDIQYEYEMGFFGERGSSQINEMDVGQSKFIFVYNLSDIDQNQGVESTNLNKVGGYYELGYQ